MQLLEARCLSIPVGCQVSTSQMGLFILPQSVGAPFAYLSLGANSMAVDGCTSQTVALQFRRRPRAVFSASRLCSAKNIQPQSALPHNVRSESPRNNSDPSSKETVAQSSR